MTRFRVILLAGLMAVSPLALGQEAGNKSEKNAELEEVLWHVEQLWLCSSNQGPYHKKIKDCVEFRTKYWPDQFFEISPKGKVQTKAEMIASQTAGIPTHVTGVGPYPQDFKLMAVYGNFALATDLTRFKTVDANGKLAFTSQCRVLRMFVKENGKWRPAGAALVPIASQ
jgi:Domain of unknown function (DUF4440)